MPPGVDRYMRWDLSPYRPWEEEHIDAEDWTTAVAFQNAWRAGIAEAEDEAKYKKG